MPQPDSDRTTGRFALPFLVFAGFFAVTENLAGLAILLSFLAINFLTIATHELGHLAAGWFVGLRLKAVRIDPIRIRLDSGQWRVKIRPRLFRGFTLMFFDRFRRVRHRLIVLVVGGPTSSLLCGVCALIVGEIGLTRHYDSPWPTFLEFFGAWAFFIGCISLVPLNVRGQANDGLLLRALLFQKVEGAQLIAAYALSTVKSRTAFQPDYFSRWFQVAATATNPRADNYYANWLAYEAAEDQNSAALFLERCLAGSALMDGDQRDLLALEAAVFTAERRNDPAKADLWSKRIQHAERLHPIWQARLKIALLCAHQEFESAHAELSRALLLIRNEPDSTGRQKLETGWIAWNVRIRERIPVSA